MMRDATDDPAGQSRPVGYGWTPSALATLRGQATRRRALLVVGLLVGIGLAWVHWLGLVVGGALVGLVSATVPRAVAAGFTLGVVVLVVQVLGSPTMGPVAFLTLTPLSLVSVATALLGPVWGSLARAVV